NLYKEHPLFYAKALDNLAYAKHEFGISKGLPDQFYQALRIRDSLNNAPGITESKLNLAEYYEDRNKIDSAKKYAYGAKDLAEKLNIKDQILKSLSILSRLESGEKGLAFSQRYIQISDSLQQQERTARNQFAR